MSNDLEPEEELWLLQAAQQNYDKIKNSGVFLSLFNHDMTKDAVPCLQLGLAMMLDKPIIVVARPDETIPENLKKVATAIYQGDLSSPEFQAFLGKQLSERSEE